MKAKSIATIFLAVLTVTACGPKNEGLDAKKKQLSDARVELQEIRKKIETIEAAIAEEDPSYFSNGNAGTLVTTISTEKKKFEHKIEVRGTVLSRTNVYVSAESMGLLTSLNVIEGQSVKKGQLLATIDSEQLEKSIDEVKNQLEYATTIFEKRERLWKQNIGTEVDYLTAKNNKESLEKQLSTLNTQLSKTNIIAPFSGSIEEVPVKAGELVQPGTPVVFLVSNSDMYINAEVSEAYMGKIKAGDVVDIRVPSMNESFVSKVVSVGNVINPASRTFTIEVTLPKEASDVKVNIVSIIRLTDYTNDNAITIPSRIIQEDLEGNFVYTLDDAQKATKVHVKLGLSHDHETEVLSGLSGGEVIVDKGNRTIADGTIVRVQN
ncbi:efflux RND transporter periplasmic adaptor subunit [Roseivirga echinicomitans]